MGVEVSAAAESATARVAVSASGGVPATPLYVLRRDANGTTLVRQTSDGATEWAAGSALRTNLLTNPAFGVDLTGWAADLGSRAAPVRVQEGADWTMEVNPATNGDQRGARTTQLVAASVADYVVSVEVRVVTGTDSPATMTLAVNNPAPASPATLSVGATTREDLGGGWWRLSAVATVTAAGDLTFTVLNTNATTADDTTYRVRKGMVEQAAAAGSYFDGATAANTAVTPTRYHRWTGTAHASTSEAYTTTSPVVYDYEARQGLETDFIVTDQDGAALASVRISLPAWGTWLKDPGAPHRNLKVLWKGDDDYTRAGQRDLIRPRGAKFPIALADRRAAPVGSVALATVTDEEARSMTTLLDSGQVLMIDVDARFGVPVRYVSIGDVTGSRASSGIFASERFWSLQVDEVAAPIGIAAGQGFTYLGIPPLADSYVALAAIFATYDDLAIGQQTA